MPIAVMASYTAGMEAEGLSNSMHFCTFMHKKHKPVFSALGNAQKCDILFGVENIKEP